MRVVVTGDSDLNTGLGRVVIAISGPIREFFVERAYGESLLKIGVVLMCRDPILEFKQRVRYTRKDKSFYMDVMLDYDLMTTSDHKNRLKLVLGSLEKDLSQRLRKYKFEDFDCELFLNDFAKILQNLGGGSATSDVPAGV